MYWNEYDRRVYDELIKYWINRWFFNLWLWLDNKDNDLSLLKAMDWICYYELLLSIWVYNISWSWLNLISLNINNLLLILLVVILI